MQPLTSEQAVTKTFRLSKRYAVEMTVGVGGFACEWEPEMPRSLTRKEERRYLKARTEMLQRLAEMIGGRDAVVDRKADGNMNLDSAQVIDPKGTQP